MQRDECQEYIKSSKHEQLLKIIDTNNSLSKDRTVGKVASLELTNSGTQPEMDSVIHFLDEMVAAGEKNLQINCRRIKPTDMQGLSVLIVLCECARIRGIKSEFVNMTEGIRSAIHVLGAMSCFSDTYLRKTHGKRN